LAFLSGLLASLLCAAALSQEYRPFPGEPVDQRTRNIQERVEELYAAGNFRRALLIYENDLATLGDKYAQYMVGYMHMNAEGTDEDRIEALAWYRLAAERGEPILERVRDELAASLSPSQLAVADRRFVELWRQLGDRVLILELVRRDMRILESRTGTRLTGSASSGSTLVFRPTGEQMGPGFFADVRRRLASRLAYLDAKVEISDDILVEEIERIRIDESRVRDQLADSEMPR
jgi:hypothetical protein